MVEIQIERLQKFKTKNIKLPEHLMVDMNYQYSYGRTAYIKKHHLDFYKEVIELWRYLAGDTLDKGHSEQLDSYKNALGSLIYI